MKLICARFGLLPLAMLVPNFSFAAVQKLAASGGAVSIFTKTKPMSIKINGKGGPPKGELLIDGEKVSGNFEFELATIDTGIDGRNNHMKNKYLEVDKYPKAKLVIEKVNHLKGWSLARPTLNDDEFEGQLTMHGETKPVSGKFSIDDKRAVEAKFTIKLTDFKIPPPEFAGITVNNEIDISVKIDKLTTL